MAHQLEFEKLLTYDVGDPGVTLEVRHDRVLSFGYRNQTQHSRTLWAAGARHARLR